MYEGQTGDYMPPLQVLHAVPPLPPAPLGMPVAGTAANGGADGAHAAGEGGEKNTKNKKTSSQQHGEIEEEEEGVEEGGGVNGGEEGLDPSLATKTFEGAEGLGAGSEGPTMLVFDFGGGTLDVTVMQSARGGSFKVPLPPPPYTF